MLKLHILQQENKTLKERLQQAEATIAELLKQAEATVADHATQVAALEQQLLAKEFHSSKNKIFVGDIDLTKDVVPPPQDFNPLLMSGASSPLYTKTTRPKISQHQQQQVQATRTSPLQLQGMTVAPLQVPPPPPLQSPVQEIVVDKDASKDVERLMSSLTMDRVLCLQDDSDDTSSSSTSGIFRTRRPTPHPSLPSVSEGSVSSASETSLDSDFRKGHPILTATTSTNTTTTNNSHSPLARLRTSIGDQPPPARRESDVGSNPSDGVTMAETLPAISLKHGRGTSEGIGIGMGLGPTHRTDTPLPGTSNTAAAQVKKAIKTTVMAVSDGIAEEEQEDRFPSLMASSSPKKLPITRTGTPLPGKSLPTSSSSTGRTSNIGGTKTRTTHVGDWELRPRGIAEDEEEEADRLPSSLVASSTTTKKTPILRTETPLPPPAPFATRGESEDTLPTLNRTRTAPHALSITEEEDEKEDESVANAVIPDEDKHSMPRLLGPGARTSTPLPSKAAPLSAAAARGVSGSNTPTIFQDETKPEDPYKRHAKGPGTRTSTPLPPRTSTQLASRSGDYYLEEQQQQQVMLLEQQDEQQEPPRPAGRITSNAVKGLPRELSIQGHDDDDDITMISHTKKDELSQTKEVHKRQVVDAFGERGMFTGSLNGKSHLPDGYGEMKYREKRSYQGYWSQGHWHGHGHFVNCLEHVYDGEFVMDQKQGPGKLIFNDGRVFTGRFQKDQMRQGKLQFQDASFYQGLLKDGKRSGFGLYVFSEQSSQYEGQWENDCMHGRGRMDWSDGGWYNGDWEMGLQHGIGMEVLADGATRHRGKWENGNPVHEDVHIT
jgi:hypothetical protein